MAILRKKTLSIFIVIILVLLAGCQTKQGKYEDYSKYSNTFFGTFDTVVQVVGYTKTEEEFNSYFEKIETRFQELHKLYDIYNGYEGINNVKTINDNAGIKPVKVDKEIIDLINFSKEWYYKTNATTNIAMGPVLKIWHDFREEADFNPANAKLPPMEDLSEAAKYTDIDKVIVNEAEGTVYLEDERMSLDVGAVAKGYAAELVAKEIMEEGFVSGIIDSGGNIRALGKPLDGVRERWGIGIQNPNKFILDDDRNLDVVYGNNISVVSSGDYQRFYVVDGKVIHHIIDPKTLMPGDYYRAVTLITEDSGLADFLSTAIFLMPYDESRKFVDSLEGVEALWIMHDETVEATDGAKKIMYSHGARGAKVK